VTTEACNAYLAAGLNFPEGLWQQELVALAKVERKSGKKFGDPKIPAGILPFRRQILHAA